MLIARDKVYFDGRLNFGMKCIFLIGISTMLLYAEQFAGCKKSFIVLRIYGSKSEAHCSIKHMLASLSTPKGKSYTLMIITEIFEHITHSFSPQVSRHVDSHFILFFAAPFY